MIRQLTFLIVLSFSTCFGFDKVVIWGHKLHSHTHSYIHNAFYRAFKHLGYETYWFDRNDHTASFDFSNTLFLTEGQACDGMPVREDCQYILHNCSGPQWGALVRKGQAFTLQVYTDDVIPRPLKKIAPCIYWSVKDRILHMPWATDLLPHEIEANKQKVLCIKKRKKIFWVGTIGDGYFGNRSEIAPFADAAKKRKVSFRQRSNISVAENERLIMKSFMAPTIVGAWQKKQGYIPCRIFKNISYGQYGVTNSARVQELFENRLIYHPDGKQLFELAYKRIPQITNEQLFQLMDFVKEKHTYINRIRLLLDFMSRVQADAH